MARGFKKNILFFFAIKFRDYYRNLPVGGTEKRTVISMLVFVYMSVSILPVVWHGSFLFCFSGSHEHQE